MACALNNDAPEARAGSGGSRRVCVCRRTEWSRIRRRNQPAFSAISRPCMRGLELTGTSSVGDWASRRRLRPSTEAEATPLLTRPPDRSQQKSAPRGAL